MQRQAQALREPRDRRRVAGLGHAHAVEVGAGQGVEVVGRPGGADGVDAHPQGLGARHGRGPHRGVARGTPSPRRARRPRGRAPRRRRARRGPCPAAPGGARGRRASCGRAARARHRRPRRPQLRQPVGVDPVAGEHLRGVLAEARAGGPDAARGLGEPERHVLEPDRSELVVVDGDDAAERGVLRVVEDVGGGVDRGDGGLGLLERGDHLVAVALGDPGADGVVELVGVLRALAAGGEPRLVDQLGAPDQPHHPLRDRLRAGGHRDPAAVGALVGVARGVVGRSGCRAGAAARRAGRRR